MAVDSSSSCSYFVSISPSKELLFYLTNRSLLLDEQRNRSEELKVEDFSSGGISFDVIRKLAKNLEQDGDGVHLHELLQGSGIVFHEPPRLPRNKELEARIQIMKRKFEDEEYKRMTASVDATVKASRANEFSSDVRILRSHMAAAFNFVITVGACFLFGYKGSEYLLPSPKLAAQLLAGLVTGTVGALADLYFLIKHLDASER